MLALGSKSGGRNRSSDPPVYVPRDLPRGTYVIRKGAIPKLPCREDLSPGGRGPPHGTAPLYPDARLSLGAASDTVCKRDAKHGSEGRYMK